MKLKIIAILAGLFLVGSLLIPGGSSVNVKNLYEEAETAFQEKRYQEAISKYEEALAEGQKWGADTKVIDEDFDSLAKYKIAASYSKLAEQLEDPSMYEKSLEYLPEIYDKTTVDMQREGIIFLWGHDYYKLERYEEAEPKFRELLNDYPESQFAENAYYSLGWLHYELKQYEKSREAFMMILEKFPNSDKIDDAQYFIARCFFDEANYDQAHLEFSKVPAAGDENLLAQARYYDGLSLLRMGRNPEALTAYQKFIADFPNNAFVTPAYFDMGTIYGKLKEYDNATRHYELAMQNTKDEVTKSEIQFQIGNNYFDQEDYQSAIEAYQKLMEVHPQSLHIPEARFMIAESHWHLKDYEMAIAGYNEVMEKDPDSDNIPYCVYKIGECYYQMNEKEMALEWYDRAITEYSDSPVVKDATYSKIWSLNDLKRYEEAEAVGREYINKYKGDIVYDIAAAETQVILGDIKFEAEDYIAAADEYLRVPVDYKDLPKFDLFKSKSLLQAGLAYYREAERNNWDKDLLAKSADAFSRLIDTYEKKFDKATRDFEYRSQYVNSAILNLGLAYTEMKEFDKARAALDIMPSDSPEYGNALFLKSRTYAEEDRIDEAVAAYDAIIKNPNLSETSRSRAAIEKASMLTDEGRYVEAAAAYQQIVDDYPASEYVATAMYLVGSSYYDMEPKTPENMNKAIEAFRNALTKYPNADTAPWAHIGIVWAYEAMGDYNMVFRTAEEIESTYADSSIPDAKKVIDRARRYKVDAMEKMEEGVSADALIAELRKVVADPAGEEAGKSSAQLRIGNVLFGEKRYAEAITEYELLLEKFPGEHVGSAYYQIAAAAYWIENYQKAADSAQKGLAASDLTQDLKTGLSYTLGLAQGKLGNTTDAIAALKQAVQIGEGAEKEQTQELVFAAHRELARVFVAAQQYTEAVEEYKYLAENSATDDEKADADFWLARTYEDNLKDYQNAVAYYEKVINLNTSEDMTARSLYYSGVLYSKELNDGEKALTSLQDLVNRFSANEGEDIKMMVTDANLRIPELLVKLGKFGDAVTRARQVRDKALAGTNTEEKVNAQYQLAYLLGEQAGQAANTGTPDPNISREAAAEYAKVYDLAKPVLNNEQMASLASASLYNAGYLLYGVGQYEDYSQAAKYFELFVTNFPKSENYSAGLEYLGFASYEAARLKADLVQFAKTAEYFLRFAREFPKSDDAPVSQFQAGEAYFAVAGGHSGNANDATDPAQKAKEAALAVEAYKKAVAAYRGVADKFPASEQAPEALYVMAASNMYMSELIPDNAGKQKALADMSAAYRELAEKYPQSENAAKAFLSVGNDYYNQASQSDLAPEDRTQLYRLSLNNYRKAMQIPGIEAKTRMAVEAYIRETEEVLARDIYSLGAGLIPVPSTDAETLIAKGKAPQAIPYFQDVIKSFPNTDYADLSLVQLGMCYEYLEDWEKSEKAYGDLIAKYTDANGNPVAPFSQNVVQAVAFARQRKGKIMAYRLSLKAQEQSQQD